jgi:hypothetical protein
MDFGILANMKFRNRPLLLLDANMLIGICHGGGQFRDVEQIMRRGKEPMISSTASVADFIKIEAFNAERREFEANKVHSFLKEVEKSENGFFVEIKTKIREELADNRAKYLDYLSKPHRNMLLKFKELSGTDIALLVTAIFIGNNDIKIILWSSDKKLVEAAEALEVATKYHENW